MSDRKLWTMEVLDEDRRLISSCWIMVDEGHAKQPANVVASVVYSIADENSDGIEARIHRTRFMLWHSIEQIAAYVRGDGTDAQRVALADGILEGRRVD